ncbi:MAG: T9SS type A sorting domain-containing protein [Ferruginibacter sp.]|nr:T9SS type A sorting domain-containing protein [Ferruginibacter sp.]
MKKLLSILFFIVCIQFVSFAQNGIDLEQSNANSKYIKAYPNPATTVINFTFQKMYNRYYSIQILNSLGKRMYSAKYIPSFLSIDLKAERLYRGVYIYQLLDRNGIIVESSKFFVVN